MIKKFSTLYAGHVDMDNLGLEGTLVDDRRYSNEYLASVYDKAEAIAQLLDRSGYDTFWLAEHHFQPEGYECLPNLLMLSVHLAHLTQNIKFGCAFNISPMWHPLRLAEDFAMADILTPNTPKDTDGRREDSGRVGEGATGEMAGLHWGRLEVGGRSSVAA